MAVLILMMATVALAAVLTQAVSAVSFSRQSQQASNLAASVLAQAESMPWSTSPSSADANYGLTTSERQSLDTNLTSERRFRWLLLRRHARRGAGHSRNRHLRQHVDLEKRFAGADCQTSLLLLPVRDEWDGPPVPPRDLCAHQRY